MVSLETKSMQSSLQNNQTLQSKRTAFPKPKTFLQSPKTTLSNLINLTLKSQKQLLYQPILSSPHPTPPLKTLKISLPSSQPCQIHKIYQKPVTTKTSLHSYQSHPPTKFNSIFNPIPSSVKTVINIPQNPNNAQNSTKAIPNPNQNHI